MNRLSIVAWGSAIMQQSILWCAVKDEETSEEAS